MRGEVKARTVELCGPPGAGKSLIAGTLAELLVARGVHVSQPLAVVAPTRRASFRVGAKAPYLVMRDTIISMVGDFNSAEGSMLPERSGDLYENVTICWLGTGAYPGNTPAGVTVSTGAAARTLIDDAVARWKARHGVTDFDTVDMTRMLAPHARVGGCRQPRSRGCPPARRDDDDGRRGPED